MIFTAPWMFLGLLALPVLAAIYWLRNRSRPLVVSSLVLWIDQRRPRQGGMILERLQTPLSFFLELLAIALLATAAAGPVVSRRETVRPLLIVLDDSYSMSAGQSDDAKDTPRRRAATAVEEEIGRDNYLTRFVLAGADPHLIGETVRTAAQAQTILADWKCESCTADLSRAIALAAEIGGPTARILVLSDHAPAMPVDGGQIEWRAFGSKRPNVAFTAATRTQTSEAERVLLEIANLSTSPSRTKLTLEGGSNAVPQVRNLDLAAGAAKQIILNLPTGAPTLRATLGDDALEIDNRATLVTEPAKPIRVLASLSDKAIRTIVLRALEATGQAVMVADRPELIVCDTPGSLDSDAWRFEILKGKDATAYAGPFVIDHNHPLMKGVSLQNAIWAAPAQTATGSPIVTAGNVALLNEVEDRAGRHRLQMRFAPELSNLQDSPDWPILFANLLHWRRTGLPGPAASNVRLGQNVAMTLGEEIKQVEIGQAGGPSRTYKVYGRRVEAPADRVGLYTVKTPKAEYLFSCNAVSRDESDLSECQTGRWGNWNRSEIHQDRQTSLGWIFMLSALAVLAAHAAVIFYGSRRIGLRT